MTATDIYINFLNDRALIESIGIVLGSYLRVPERRGDHALINPKKFNEWLRAHDVLYYYSQPAAQFQDHTQEN